MKHLKNNFFYFHFSLLLSVTLFICNTRLPSLRAEMQTLLKLQVASTGSRQAHPPNLAFSTADATTAERKAKEQNLFITDSSLNLSTTEENNTQLL